MSVCKICRFQIVDDSVRVCPNCGAPIEACHEDEVIEEISPNLQSPGSGEIPSDGTDDNIQICHPGDMLDRDETGVSEETMPTEENIPQPSPPPENSTAENGHGQIKRLSDEQVRDIRSNLINDPEYVSPGDASSIMNGLNHADQPPAHDWTPESAEKMEPKVNESPAPPADNDQTPEEKPNPDITGAAVIQSPPIKRVAYFHKNFIQLTGPFNPLTGEEMVIGDRHYLLKQKRIKQQHAIVAFSVLLVILLLVIGSRFISPTLPGNGSIIGIVLDQQKQPYINGAEVALPEIGKKVVSDASGFFRFTSIPTGVYEVTYTFKDGTECTEHISVASDQITTLALGSGNNEQSGYAAAGVASVQPTRNRNSNGQTAPPQTMPPAAHVQETTPQPPKSTTKEYSALKLNAKPGDVKLTVNGQVLGVGNLTYKKLGPGKHSVSLTRDGYKAWTGKVTLKPGETYTLSVQLEKTKAASEEPTYSAEDFYQSGKAMLADGNMANAVKDFTQAVTMQPSMADAFRERAQAYEMLKDNAAAEADYIRAGEIYSSRNQRNTAADMFSRAAGINPQSVPAHLNLGSVYQAGEDMNAAIDEYDRVLRIDKDNFRANFELGKLYFASGRTKDADKKLRKAQELNPRSPEVYHYLMLNYFARDDFGKVKKTYGQFKENVNEGELQAFKQNMRFDAILRIVGEYERP